MKNQFQPGRVLRWLTMAAILTIPWLAPRSANAQAPQGHVAHIFPAGGQQGTTVQVTVGGSDLGDAKEVRVTGDGVTGKVIKVDKAATATISVTIAADAKCGQRDLRLVTAGGVTNRSRFIVGQLPEVMETEPNSQRDAAQPLPAVPVVVNGQIFGADKDSFRFSAKAGQTIVCRVRAQQLLPFMADAVPGWFQAVLTLCDADGNRLAYVDDFRFHPDPVLIHEIERDGEYVVEIRDSIFRGREDFVYRLSVGALPYVTHVYPLGAPRQTTAKVNLFGANLPDAEMDLELTSDCPSLRRVESSRGGIFCNSLPFAVGETPETEETEPNGSPQQANPIEMPVTINGRIGQPGDVDCFTFTAQAQQQLLMDVQARRLDSPLDSILTVLDANGLSVAQNDDAEDNCQPLITHHADSRLVYTFRRTGKYVVRIADVQGKGGQEFAYRLMISPPQPDFQLRLTPDNPRMGQGATTVLTVHALRRDDFNGQIDLSVEGLPQGFTASGTVIPEDVNEVILTLTAPSDAPLGIHMPTITGTATIGDRTVTRRALPAEDVMQAFIYHHLLPTDEFLLTVVEPGPFKLIPQMPEGFIRFGAGRTAFLVVKAERKPEAKGAIRLTLSNPPQGVRMPNAVIPPGKDEVKCEIRYPNKTPNTVRYNLILSGTMRVGKETLTTIAPAILALGPGAKAPTVAKQPATSAATNKPPSKPDAKPKPNPKPQPKPDAKPQPKPNPKPDAKPQNPPAREPAPAVRQQKPRRSAAARQATPMMQWLAGIALTDQQKAQLKELQKALASKTAETREKLQAILTKEQKAARNKALQEGRAAGKTGRELWQTAQAAVNLTVQQKAEQARLRKDMAGPNQEFRQKLLALLTPEQKQALKEKTNKARVDGGGQGVKN